MSGDVLKNLTLKYRYTDRAGRAVYVIYNGEDMIGMTRFRRDQDFRGEKFWIEWCDVTKGVENG